MLETVLMFVLMGAALYFLMIRPQQKRAKEQQNLMSALAVGSRIMTISGIIGTVKHLGEKQAVIEVSPGVEMTIDKRAISPQPVEDEFEYADSDGDGDLEPELVEVAEPVETAAAEAPVAIEPEPAPAEVAEVVEPTDGPVAWDAPAPEKN